MQAWLNGILQKEKQYHIDFFGKEFDLSGFQQTLQRYGEARIQEWKALLLEPHFLPKVSMDRKTDFPGFKIKPSDHCYEVVYQGRVLRDIDGKLQKDLKAHWLLGQTVLIDTRLKPAYQHGRQMWSDDNLLGPIIQNLREEGRLARYDYGYQSSRFRCSDLDFEDKIKPVLTQKLNITFRLERAVEGVVIPQLYPDMPRKDDGTTNTWVWYEEFFGGRAVRVGGGGSVSGGLADVRRVCSGARWDGQSFRPLAVL